MSGWTIFGLIVVVLIILAILFNLKDIRRYIKISSM
ncbi:DUF6893 family small protein [Methylocapsa polymorpha]